MSSVAWIKRKWDRMSIVEFSDMRKWGFRRVHPINQVLQYYSFSINDPNNGTLSLFHHKPLIYCCTYDFSSVFHYFIKKMIAFGISFNDDTSSLHEYHELFIKKEYESINSIVKLKEKIHGYLQLYIQEATSRKNLAFIERNERKYYILGGIYISPFSKSLLNDCGKINGIQLDTTWKIIPMYVTSILMSCTLNTGIPLGFAFGSGEDKQLYSKHFDAFKKATGIDLSHFVIQSDQGSALKAICEEKNVVHLACLRHLLVSLKFNEFSYCAGILVKCASLLDLNKALASFAEDFTKIKDEAELKELNKVLGKIGMHFSENTINITDPGRWKQVSMLCRIEHKMPSTTNSLESSHGHLNRKTPRHNNFWEPLARIAESFLLKTQTVDFRVQNNYNYTKRTTLRKAHNTPADKMQEMFDFYSTRIDHCDCGENKLESAMYGIDIPCSHRCIKGASFPPCPTFDFHPVKQWEELIDDYVEIPSSTDINQYDENEGKKKYATNIIRRFSKYSNKEEIENYVKENYNSENDAFFINGTEVTLIQLIYRGIAKFSSKKKDEKKV